MEDPALRPLDVNNVVNSGVRSPKNKFGVKKRVAFTAEGVADERFLIIVMSADEEKEKNTVVKKVGSGSTWGLRERNRFRIQESREVDARQMIGDKWFSIDSLSEAQQEGKALCGFFNRPDYIDRRKCLLVGKPAELFAERKTTELRKERLWSTFRSCFRSIYNFETGAGFAHVTRQRGRTRHKAQGVVSGRKEAATRGAPIFFFCSL